MNPLYILKKGCTLRITGIVLFVVLLLGLQNIQSQELIFKPFRVELGISLDVPSDDQAGTGFGGYIEPRYAINDKVIVGVHLGMVYLNSSEITINASNVDIKYTIISPIMITGEYFFKVTQVRPFVGLGVGMYKKTLGGVETSINGVNIGSETETLFGIAPRVGINTGHFRFSLTYHLNGKGISDFMGIHAGLEIGGGRIKKN